jgi:hypothetical protein
VHGRLEAGFRHRFRSLLALVGPRRLDFGVELLMGRARRRAAREGTTLGQALAALYEDTRRRVARRLEVTGACAATPPWRFFNKANPPRFLCDPSLAGLARWLRAAGYEAMTAPELPGHRLPDEALRKGMVLVTTETETLDRRIVADGSLLLVWLPSALGLHEQLAMVLRDLGLTLLEPRCMACGGRLLPTAKETVEPRIPPRTARWKDEYFLCGSCDRLFWQGTHWERIERALEAAVGR